MSAIRRVVTGHAPDGKSIIASDQAVERFGIPGMPGLEMCKLWGGDRTMSFPDAGDCPAYSSFFPPVGGFRLLEFTIAPDGTPAPADAGHTSSAAELERLLPGLSATMDPDVPGMHRSATVDLLYVISGTCILELDDGSRTELRAGNVAIQSGTMHAWRNPYSEPCRILGVTIGATLK